VNYCNEIDDIRLVKFRRFLMRKMIFGMMLFISGFIGLLYFTYLAIKNPWNYNGITGFKGFLLGTDSSLMYYTTLSMFISGILICIFEVYPIKIKPAFEKFVAYMRES
jgi:hypothetical protein